MRNLLLHWILSAIAIWVVSQIVPGFTVDGAGAALVAALIIGLINGTIGFALKLITLPFAILSFGLIFLVINALMLMLASSILQGFHVDGFVAAFLGGIVLAIVNLILRMLTKKD